MYFVIGFLILQWFYSEADVTGLVVTEYVFLAVMLAICTAKWRARNEYMWRPTIQSSVVRWLDERLVQYRWRVVVSALSLDFWVIFTAPYEIAQTGTFVMLAVLCLFQYTVLLNWPATPAQL